MSRTDRRKPRPLIVLVDMDCVLADFEGHFHARFRERYPDEPHVPIEERNTFYVSDQYVHLGEHLVEKCNAIIYEEGFFDTIPPFTEGIEAVKDMSGMDNVEVFLCTSPCRDRSTTSKEKMDWVARHLGIDWVDHIILTRDKTVIFGDLLIDDKPKITGKIRHPAWQHILFTACHNKHLTLSSLRCRQRLDNWTDGKWKSLVLDAQKQI